MNTTKLTEKEQLELAAKAVEYMLRRISEDPNVRYHVGYGSQAFDNLVEAHAAITGEDREVIEESVLGEPLAGAAAVKLKEIQKLLNDEDLSDEDRFNRISEVVR